MGIGKRPLSEEEFRSIIEHTYIYFNFPTNVREKTIWTLQASTGLRVNEVLQLKVRDVYHAGKIAEYVTVQRSYMKGKIMGRNIPIGPMAHDAIEDYMRVFSPLVHFTPSGSLWVTSRRQGYRLILLNQPPHDRIVRTHLKTICAYLNIDASNVSTHSFRKMFAKRVYEKMGNDLLAAQKALGHTSIKSTIHYLDSCDTQVDNAIRDLWDQMWPNKPE